MFNSPTCLVALLLGVFTGIGCGESPPKPDPVSEAQSALFGSNSQPPLTVVESARRTAEGGRVGRVDMGSLTRLMRVDDTLDIELFDGGQRQVLLGRIRPIGRSGASWFGRVADDPRGFFSVSYLDGQAAGSARIDGQKYRISTDDDGDILLTEVVVEEDLNCTAGQRRATRSGRFGR